MLSVHEMDDDDDANRYFIRVDFGTVPVGSVHKRSIEIKNDLKKPTKFQVKNNNESMYLADSISFEPSITPRIFPNKKTNFLITFSPKSMYIRTTLEYFTIFSMNNESTEVIFDEFNTNNEYQSDENSQKVTISIWGSCYGPSVTIFPTKIFLYPQLEGKKQGQNTTKLVNLINSSKMPGQYHIQYDCVNCPLICHPSSGIIENRVQIKVELNAHHIGYYYKRLYILILNHHPVYVDVYAFSGTVTNSVDPFSYFRTLFEPPIYENNYEEFFKDIAHPSFPKQQVVVFPKDLQFGYAKNTKTLYFEMHNNSDFLLYINWIHGPGCENNSFTIHSKWSYIESHDKKTIECTFQPKTISNIYFAEFEAIVRFSSDLSPPPLDNKILPKYVAPMNISITATGHSFKKPFNGWKPKCKLNTHKIIMPPSVPDSRPVFATLLIKKVVRVPMTFEFRSPDNSIFLVNPKCGLINGDFQIVVFQLLKTCSKESVYAERWNIVFDGFENNTVSFDVYASVEFGCVTIGEKNRVIVPGDVQVECAVDVHIPIVNTTRHRLNYYVHLCDQYPRSDVKSPPSTYSGYDEFESEEMEETEYRHTNSSELHEDTVTTDVEEPEDNKSSSTSRSNSRIMSIDSAQTPIRVLRDPNLQKTPSPGQIPFVFKFDKVAGELGPNEKSHLTLSFCPLKSVPYTVDAKCYLICNDFPEIVNILPVVIKGSGCDTRFKITPVNCFLNNMLVNMERTQRFIIENTNSSYANIKIVLMPAICPMIFSPIPFCKISPDTFCFTPQKNQCKMDLSIQPTELGFQKFFIEVQIESKVESYSKNDNNIITVAMDVIMCALQISRITNDSIPYFGKLALNKLFHYIKINNELSKVYKKNISPLIWTIPVISEPTEFEFQFYNLLKIPVSWTLKYNKCNKCTSENNNKYYKNIRNKDYNTLSNKCVHYKNIQISPMINLKMEDFSKFKIELSNINEDQINLSYKWLSGTYKPSLYNTELLIEPIMFQNDLTSFDPKYGTNGHLEFNFIPIFIAHPNPPAQAFWMYNSNSCNVKYSIIEDSLTPAYPYFRCLNPSGIVNSKSVHPILFIFSPDKLCIFKATVMLFSNNNRRHITLIGQGESYTRTPIWLEPGMSSFLPIKNDRKIFLSTESIILKPMFTCSNSKAMFRLYNNIDEEIIYEWNKCTIANILTANVIPIKGNVKGHSSKVFEITFTSYYQPAIFTIMFNISYKLVFQNENYKQSLRNYNINKDKLDGVFIINECGNYKPKLIMKLENQPKEKHLVLYVFVRIIDQFNNKWTNETKKNHSNCQQEKPILKQKIQNSNNFKNIIWSIMDKMCLNKIEYKLYYHQLKKYKKKNPKKLSKTTKNNLEFILTALIRDSLINIYPSNIWGN